MKDKDDNQKFLEKFKDQITTMGKNGILDTNNNHNIKITINKNINSKGRKGSAFLKPINKTKTQNNNNLITEPLKNNLANNRIDKDLNNNNNIDINNNNIDVNNAYIERNNSNLNQLINNNTNNNISPILYYKYQNPYMYYNYNTNLYMNNNIQPNNIYPPYQFYYFPNNNQNVFNPHLIQNNYPNKENNKISNNPTNKKKLRPISAQNISNNNRSYLTNNNNNITNLTLNNKSNMTNINRYEYKPYTLKDYKEIMNVDTLGGLGANIGTEDWNKKKEKMDKMSEYAKNIFKKTKTAKNKSTIKNKKKEEISTRKRANEYSKLIRPKSSGHFNVNVVKRNNNYGINNKLNVINNDNIIQGKMALINAKKLNEKNNNANNKINENNNIDKMKDIFDENQDETNDDKEMLEYYNKFKINENEILGEVNYNNDNNKANNSNEDSLEMKKEEENNNIDDNNINTIKKFSTFKEQRNAANKKNNNIKNIINKDNNINEEFNYNEEKEKEVNIESLFSEREKYLKEIENIKKGLQQK